MKLHVFLHAAAECESNVTQSTMVCNFAGLTLQVVPGGTRRLVPHHTDHNVMDSPQYESLCVSLYGSLR